MRTRGSKREPLAERDENARAKEAAQDKKGSRKLTDTQLLDHALQEIDKFVRLACQEIEDKVEEGKAALQRTQVSAITRLPRDVRSMTVKSYLESGGDLSQIIQKNIDERIAAIEQSVSTVAPTTAGAARGRTRTAVKRQAAPLQTAPRTRRKVAAGITTPAPSRAGAGVPAPSSVLPSALGTAARMPQIGEAVFSARGSPLGINQDGGITPMVGSALPSAVTQRRGTKQISITSVPRAGGKSKGRTTRAQARQEAMETVEEGEEEEEEEEGACQVPERFEFALDGRTIRMEDGQISVSGESDHTGLLQTLQSLGGALQSAIQSITSLVGGKK